jgi:uncharacterized protein (TIGR02996 family)
MAGMNLEQAILQALHDNPGDEASWLALTDWLEEQGCPRRAELLRLHRGLRGAPEGPARRATEERIGALLREGVRPCMPVLKNSLGMELVLIPAGTFLMGDPDQDADRDETPLHEVEISRPFYLGAHLVTQEQYQRVTGDNPSRFRDSPDSRRFPIEGVTWHLARDFAEALSALPEEKAARRLYRLPREAEWEYACRAWFSPHWMFHQGDALSPAQANIRGEAEAGTDAEPFLGRPSAVGSYPPNAFGLFDLHGNLAEWCSDWYRPRYYARSPRKDPKGASRGRSRVLRGGAWGDRAASCRTARRIAFTPETVHDALGLRVAMTVRPNGRAFRTKNASSKRR